MCIAGGVKHKTANWHDCNVLCSREGDVNVRETRLPGPSMASSIIKVKIIGHIQQNQHHSLSPRLADQHRNSAPYRAKWWLAQVEEEKVRKYACKNTRHCNDAIKFSIKYILQSIAIPQVAPNMHEILLRFLPDCILSRLCLSSVFRL